MAANAQVIKMPLDTDAAQNDAILDELKSIVRLNEIKISTQMLEVIANQVKKGILCDTIDDVHHVKELNDTRLFKKAKRNVACIILKIMQSRLVTRINRLIIGNVFIESNEWLEIMDIISRNTHLTHLVIGEPLGGSCLGHVLWTVVRDNKTLTSLSLYNNSFNNNSFSCLFFALNTNHTLRRLSIKGQGFSPHGFADLIAELLPKNTTLLSLSLKHLFEPKDDANKIIEAALENRTLTSLDMSYNNLPMNSLKALPGLIQHNQTLRALNLNYLKNTGVSVEDTLAADIGNALVTNNTLTSFGICDKLLNSKYRPNFAQALERNSSLNTLCLNASGPFDNIYDAVLPSLIKNRGLTCLRVFSRTISNKSAFIETFKANRNLTDLLFDDPTGDISDNGKAIRDAIQPFLTRNRARQTNLARVALLERFMIANVRNTFSTSILTLIPTIVDFMNKEFNPKPPTFNAAKLSQFTQTRYFQAQLAAVARAADPVTPITIGEMDATANETELLPQFRQSISQSLTFARTTNAVPSTAFAASAASTVTTATTASLLMPPSNSTTASTSSLSMPSKEGTKHTPANRKRKK